MSFLLFIPPRPLGSNGEDACVGHGYSQDECVAVDDGTCCQWDDGGCFSDIGQDMCNLNNGFYFEGT